MDEADRFVTKPTVPVLAVMARELHARAAERARGPFTGGNDEAATDTWALLEVIAALAVQVNDPYMRPFVERELPDPARALTEIMKNLFTIYWFRNRSALEVADEVLAGLAPGPAARFRALRAPLAAVDRIFRRGMLDLKEALREGSWPGGDVARFEQVRHVLAGCQPIARAAESGARECAAMAAVHATGWPSLAPAGERQPAETPDFEEHAPAWCEAERRAAEAMLKIAAEVVGIADLVEDAEAGAYSVPPPSDD